MQRRQPAEEETQEGGTGISSGAGRGAVLGVAEPGGMLLPCLREQGVSPHLFLCGIDSVAITEPDG